MFSPYEELEYLADHLPNEGEAVLISREQGELVCKPWHRGNLREGVHDPELYGFLVQANERLNSAGNLPIWVSLLVFVWLTIGLHGLLGLGWDCWFLVPGLAPLGMFACFHWIRSRQHLLFSQTLLPLLKTELKRRGISSFSIVSGVRQHAELRTLLDELVRWSPVTAESQSRRRKEDTLS